MKWLAAATVAIVIVLFVLWRQLNKSDAAPLPEESVTKPTEPARDRGDIAMPQPAAKPAAGEPESTEAAPPTPTAAAPTGATEKVDPAGDEYFYRFIEAIPKKTTMNAAKCYEGIAKRLHRNQKMSVKFTAVIKDGTVTMKDVTVKENTLDNAALENCFLAEVQRTTWKDDSLPDGEYPDELVLRPERGMKKYSRENIDYVGGEAPPIESQAKIQQ